MLVTSNRSVGEWGAVFSDPAVAKLLHMVKERIPRCFGMDPVRDIQVLCPMNRGGLGARSLNIELQGALDPPGALRVERFGRTFGIVTAIDPEEGTLTAGFDARPVTYDRGELDEVGLAYAISIDKSRGSEYPVLPITMQPYTMLQRNLVYTGITRAKRPVVMVGQRRALAKAVRGTGGRRRWSRLRDWQPGFLSL